MQHNLIMLSNIQRASSCVCGCPLQPADADEPAEESAAAKKKRKKQKQKERKEQEEAGLIPKESAAEPPEAAQEEVESCMSMSGDVYVTGLFSFNST